MAYARVLISGCIAALLLATGLSAQAEDEQLIFAVVSEIPKDRSRVAARISINDVVSDAKLFASETILNNLIWKKLEICHAVRIEGVKVPEGIKVSSVRVIDAAMLPMSLQTFAGDCLIKKAIEVAPFLDEGTNATDSRAGKEGRVWVLRRLRIRQRSRGTIVHTHGRGGFRNRQSLCRRFLSGEGAPTGQIQV